MKQKSGTFIAERTAKYNVDDTEMNLVRLLNPPYSIYLKKTDAETLEVCHLTEPRDARMCPES